LKEGGRANAERSRRLVRSLLIAAQVAFSYVLLIGAGLMVHSLIQMNRVDAGFVPQRVFAVGFDRNWSTYRTMEQRRTYSNRLLTGVQSQTGVLMAAVSDSFPFDPDMMDMRWHFRIEGDARPRAAGPSAKSVRNASPTTSGPWGFGYLAGGLFSIPTLTTLLRSRLSTVSWRRVCGEMQIRLAVAFRSKTTVRGSGSWA